MTTEVAALVSTSVSSSCKAALTVELSVIMLPVKVPRSVASLATPLKVIRLSPACPSSNTSLPSTVPPTVILEATVIEAGSPTVKVLAAIDVSISLAVPAIVSVSESRSIPPVPVSPAISKSVADSRLSTSVSSSCKAVLMSELSVMMPPVKVPRSVEFSATPLKVIRSSTFASISLTTEVAALVSTSVSRSCNAPLTVSLSAIVLPVKVPRSVEFSATPLKVIRSSTFASISLTTERSALSLPI